MTTSQSPDPLFDQVYHEQNLKSTEDLLAIWRANDRAEWTSTAFDAIQKILLERLGSVPEQAAPPAREEAFYDLDRVITLAERTTTASWIVLGGFVLVGLFSFVSELFGSTFSWTQVVNLLPTFLLGIFFFTILRVLSEALYLLLELAENSRSRL